jgi:hypothetical protein
MQLSSMKSTLTQACVSTDERRGRCGQSGILYFSLTLPNRRMLTEQPRPVPPRNSHHLLFPTRMEPRILGHVIHLAIESGPSVSFRIMLLQFVHCHPQVPESGSGGRASKIFPARFQFCPVQGGTTWGEGDFLTLLDGRIGFCRC